MSAINAFLKEARQALAASEPVLDQVTIALGRLSAADLGLNPALLPLSSAEPIRQEAIFEHPDFSVGLFLLQAGQFLPLHDHPEMTVWLKVLCGRLRVRSFDWIKDGEKQPEEAPRLARSISDLEVDASSRPQVLEPKFSNLHEIVALEDAAFLDVFSPYYSDEHPCTYYRVREPSPNDGSLFWLEAVPEYLAWKAPVS